MKVRIIKLKEAPKPEHKYNVEVGKEIIGRTVRTPKVGERFYVNHSVGHYFVTSAVQKIISENTFQTYNSVYQWTIIEE